MIDKISLATPSAYTGIKSATNAASAAGGSFANVLAQALDSVSGAQTEAADLAKKFQMGDPKVSLEDTMISMSKANVSFQATVQVRNRLTSAYHDIMNMSV
jgi:flagellar hook-basal body complex protein FliE